MGKPQFIDPKYSLNPNSRGYVPIKIKEEGDRVTITQRNILAGVAVLSFAMSLLLIVILKSLPGFLIVWILFWDLVVIALGIWAFRLKAQMVLNLSSRSYVLTSRLKTERGGFDDLLGVVITKTNYMVEAGKSGPNFRVTIFRRDRSPMMDLYLGSNPTEAMRIAQTWKSKLQIELVDQTT